MSRYIIRFAKQGNIKYISHLDTLRMFKRAFRRTPVRLRYSQGYNPHPKMGFTMPLSLGFETVGDYLEIETDENYESCDIMSWLNGALPAGITAKSCSALPEASKTPSAAAVEYASYTAEYNASADDAALRIKASVPEFMRLERIESLRYSKKKKEYVETDIRPLINSLNSVEKKNGGLLLSMMLKAGNSGNLNPTALLKALTEYAGAEYREQDWRITRTDMYFSDKKRGILSLERYKG